MYRKMRQDRKKFKDDDTGSVISEARSQRSMVIDGSSVMRNVIFKRLKKIDSALRFWLEQTSWKTWKQE